MVSAEEALATRNAELAAWAQRSRHDLMTPLTVISGMAETLERAWERLSEADRVSMLAAIRSQTAKAIALVDEALASAADSSPSDQPRPQR